MITLHSLERRRDAKFKVKRVGRGVGSGLGGHSSTRGVKGQKSRSGAPIQPGFEGGQTPLQRRLPKKGFKSIFKTRVKLINLDKLEKVAKGTVVDLEYLKKVKMISSLKQKIKVLARGDVKHALTVKAHFFSDSARKKIEKAGGQAEVISGRN